MVGLGDNSTGDFLTLKSCSLRSTTKLGRATSVPRMAAWGLADSCTTRHTPTPRSFGCAHCRLLLQLLYKYSSAAASDPPGFYFILSWFRYPVRTPAGALVFGIISSSYMPADLHVPGRAPLLLFPTDTCAPFQPVSYTQPGNKLHGGRKRKKKEREILLPPAKSGHSAQV